MVSGEAAWQGRHACASATAAGGLQGLQALSPRRWPPLGAFIKLPALRVVHDLADFERSITLRRDATSIGQLICLALRNRSDQKWCPQSALQSLENQSRFSSFWLIKKEIIFDQMSGERIVFATIHAALLLLPMSDRSLSTVY
jgi:hypothetical protein